MNRFSELPEFLKEYIHERRWDSFRSIQTETFGIFAESDDHILISSSTSSGKTEAALFPVIASLYNDSPESIGALYIGPLKALIDDQFGRISEVIEKSDIEITEWHGDVGSGRKKALVKDPKGILQITPESLQNIVSDDRGKLNDMFRGLRFVIIDEIHSFMDSDRGLQLLCCLETIERVSGCRPRRIGLSATISDTAKAERWLSANTGRKTVTVAGKTDRDSDLRITYSLIPSKGVDEDGTERKRAVTAYYRTMFREIKGRNCIVFVNSRIQAEKVSRSLNVMAERNGMSGIVSVHHSSITKEQRKISESELRDYSKKTATVATSTLELGIDVGAIDRIVQIDPPFTCSSFLQRMGRSGRRNGRQEMTLMCCEDREKPWMSILGIPMDLIKAIATAELALSGWTEPLESDSLPYSLLYHQTMEYMKSGAGARFSELKENVLSLYPFRNIGEDEYKILLRHMWAHGDLTRMDDGTLLIGPKSENIVFHRDFCSVFSSSGEVDVYFNDSLIGTVQNSVSVGDIIQLAGGTWVVADITENGSRVEVEQAEGSSSSPWKSGVPCTDTKVMKKMREILMSDEKYPYLSEEAAECLERSRRIAAEEGICKGISKNGDSVMIWPWIGTKAFDTVRHILKASNKGKIMSLPPYCITFETDMSADDVASMISSAGDSLRNRLSLVDRDDSLYFKKYDRHVPTELLKHSFVANRLDFDFKIE